MLEVADMLIGEVLERVPLEESWQMAANKLADTVRNIYLNNTRAGYTAWEEGFSESPVQVEMIRNEGFLNVYEIEYIFKWWGDDSDPEALAGELEVIWKLQVRGAAKFYKTRCRLAERDFVVGVYGTEGKKREAFRAEFLQAFQTWRKLLENI